QLVKSKWVMDRPENLNFERLSLAKPCRPFIPHGIKQEDRDFQAELLPICVGDPRLVNWFRPFSPRRRLHDVSPYLLRVHSRSGSVAALGLGGRIFALGGMCTR